MPLQRCKLPSGKSGWKYGSSGKCYPMKKDAIKQGLAIEGPDKFKEEMSKSGLLERDDVREIMESLEPQGADRYTSAIASHVEKKTQELTESDDYAVAYVSVEERKKIPLSNFADPSRRAFPINNQAHLDAAVKLVGREPAQKQAAIKARIKEIAHRLGLKLPASWETKSSKK